MQDSTSRINRDDSLDLHHQCFDEVVESGKKHFVKEYADFPKAIPILVKAVHSLMEHEREKLVRETAGENRKRVIKRRYRKVMKERTDALFSGVKNAAVRCRETLEEKQRLEQQHSFSLDIQDYLKQIDAIKKSILSDSELEVWRSLSVSEKTRDRPPWRYYWYGADVYITDKECPEYKGSKIICCTPYAPSLSALFYFFVKKDPGVLNHQSKYEFFGIITEEVIKLIEYEKPTNRQVLLKAVDTAESLLNELLARLYQ